MTRRNTPPGVPISNPLTGADPSTLFVEIAHADGIEVTDVDTYLAFPEDVLAQTKPRFFRWRDGERVYVEHELAALFEVA